MVTDTILLGTLAVVLVGGAATTAWIALKGVGFGHQREEIRRSIQTVLGLLADDLGASTIRCAPRYWIAEQMGRLVEDELDDAIRRGLLAPCAEWPVERIHFPPMQSPKHKRRKAATEE